MKYSLRSLMIAAAVVPLFLGGVYWLLREQGEVIRDAYCVDWASGMVIQYMDDNDDKFPKSWSDLRPPYEKLGGLDHGFPFAEIQSRVEVDFAANSLANRDDATRPLVWLKSGRRVSWEAPEPNERVWARIARGKPHE